MPKPAAWDSNDRIYSIDEYLQENIPQHILCALRSIRPELDGWQILTVWQIFCDCQNEFEQALEET